MDRLEKDLAFFKQELAKERNSFRRDLLLTQILEIETEITALFRAKRDREAKMLQNLLEAIAEGQKRRDQNTS